MQGKSLLHKIISTALVFMAVGGIIVLSGEYSHGMIEVGSKYVSFQGKDLKGKTVKIDDYIGKKIILLKFGSIYCSTCVSSLKDVASISERVGTKNLQVIGVNLDVYGIYRVKRFYRGYERFLTYPMIIDEKLKISTPYRVQTLPAHVLIDRDGVVKYVSTGASEKDFEDLEKVISKLLKGEKDLEEFAKIRPLELYLPQNFSKTVQDSIYVVGKASGKDMEIFLTLNGGMKQVIKSMRDVFYIRTPLTLGSNYIEVKIKGKDGASVQQGLVLFREPKIGLGIESPFPEYHFHTESNEKACQKCHDLNPPQIETGGFAVATQFCLGCHKELEGNRYVHGPIPVGGCSPCHDFSSTPNRYKVIGVGQDLCFNCHEDKRDELLKEYLHGPISAGVCTICHNPHGSNEKYNLRKYVGDLCVMCHVDFKTQMYKEHVHKPFQDGLCTNCHFAHSSDRKDSLVVLPGMELCKSCHGDTIGGHKHPYGEPPHKELNVTLDEDGNLMCLSCHKPHASEDEKLLPKGGCKYCHQG